MLMTYKEAKIVEAIDCEDNGRGRAMIIVIQSIATKQGMLDINEVASVAMSIATMLSKGWLYSSVHNEKTYLHITLSGDGAYRLWKDIPF